MARASCLAAALLIVFSQLALAGAENQPGTSAGAESPVQSAGATEETGSAGGQTDVPPEDGQVSPPAQPGDESAEPAPEGTPADSGEPSPQGSSAPSAPKGEADTLTLSVGGASLDFGSLEPGTARTIAGPVIRVTSGRPFDLAYRAHDFQRGVSISHLSYRHEGGYVPFSNSGVLESDHAAGTYEWQESYRLELGFDVPAGSYRTSITYTATPH